MQFTTPKFVLETDIVKGRQEAERVAADARIKGWDASVRFLFGLTYEVRMSRMMYE